MQLSIPTSEEFHYSKFVNSPTGKAPSDLTTTARAKFIAVKQHYFSNLMVRNMAKICNNSYVYSLV